MSILPPIAFLAGFALASLSWLLLEAKSRYNYNKNSASYGAIILGGSLIAGGIWFIVALIF
ncbi:MAG: hypothetical protein EBR82_62240 [Caulobacteraceae bacterium]|nr:hypothetical protein [Caulobacteraceae bacterium]